MSHGCTTACCYTQTADILSSRSDVSADSVLNQTFDIVIDKGTYDAISLNPDEPAAQRARYISNTLQLIAERGLFVMTSCNWTEHELTQHFETGDYQLPRSHPLHSHHPHSHHFYSHQWKAD